MDMREPHLRALRKILSLFHQPAQDRGSIVANFNRMSSQDVNSPSGASKRPTVDLNKVARGESARLALSQRNGSVSPTNHDHYLQQPTFHATNVYKNAILGNERSVVGNKSMKRAHRHREPTYKEFGLQGWREYAALKFSDHEKFIRSPHGKNIVVAEALREYQREMRALLDWADEVEATALDLQEALADENARRVKAETYILQLEAELKRQQACRKSPDSPSGSRGVMDTKKVLTAIAEVSGTMDHESVLKIAQKQAKGSRTSGGLVRSSSPSMLSPWMQKRLSMTGAPATSSSGGKGGSPQGSPTTQSLSQRPLEALEEELSVQSPVQNRDYFTSSSSQKSSWPVAAAAERTNSNTSQQSSGDTPSSEKKRREHGIMSKIVNVFGSRSRTKSGAGSDDERSTGSASRGVLAPDVDNHHSDASQTPGHTHSADGSVAGGDDLEAIEKKINEALKF